MKTDNESIDAKILSALGKVPQRAGTIRKQTKIEMRVIDRAFQRLRRSGKIKLVTGAGGGWVLA